MVMGTLGDDAKTTITGVWFLSGCTLLMIITRLFVRIKQYKRMQPDDFVIIFVALLVIGESIATMFVINRAAEFEIFKRDLGGGLLDKRHHWWVKQKITEYTARVYLAGGVMWVVSLWGLKCCLIIWFSRIATALGKQERWMVRIAGFIGGLTLASSIVATFLECSPLNSLSGIHADPGKMCSGTDIPLLVTGASNIFTDFMMLAIAIPLIHKNTHKAPLFFLFSLGIATTASGIIRLRSSLDNPDDLITPLWANAEIFCACVVVNVPLIRTALRTNDEGYVSLDERSVSRASRASRGAVSGVLHLGPGRVSMV